MEYLKVADQGKASPKRDFRVFRGRNQRNLKSNLLEAIAQANIDGDVVSHTNEDGVVRMKIMVKREDLKQMLQVIKGDQKNNININEFSHQPSFSPSSSVEQQLNLLRRKHLLRANAKKESRPCSWIPALQTIPEELNSI